MKKIAAWICSFVLFGAMGDYVNAKTEVLSVYVEKSWGLIDECFFKIEDAETEEVVYNEDTLREAVTSYALQFIGNPYEWGGTSLTSGADCSGFIQSIYAAFGYELPRVAGEQSECGEKLPVEEAEPGDLIFYEKDGCIYHVVMYLGDGKTIEAANSEKGIICSEVNTKRAVWAVSVISDVDTDKLLTLD